MKKNRKRSKSPPEKPAGIEIRNHANGRPDEIVAHKSDVHLEQMDSGFGGWAWKWMAVASV